MERQRYQMLERRNFFHPKNKRPACDIPIFDDSDIYNNQNSRSSSIDSATMRNTKLLLSYIIETENDDDIDTDEDVLKAGKKECMKDLLEI